jgi:hypothetical protein
MTIFSKTFGHKAATITDPDRDFSFWFAVLSPLLGILAGFLALFLFYR